MRHTQWLICLMVWIIFFICSGKIAGQGMDFCRYFSLNVEKTADGDDHHFSYYPDIRKIPGDALSSFMQSHSNRFHYLLNNKLGSIHDQLDLNGTTAQIDSGFCKLMHDTENFMQYIGELIPHRDDNIRPEKNAFTMDEMMNIASRFFHVESINESDTTIQRAICVGRHGVSDLALTKDFSSLEAFIFEAVFYDILRKNSRLEANFESCIDTSLRELRSMPVTLPELLRETRARCYSEMAQDEYLKKHLLRYYHKNRDNVSWRLE